MRLLLKLFLMISVAFSGTAFAAAPSAVRKDGKKQQVVLTSEGGLEWDSNKKTLTAEQKALVVRGDTALGADKITAYYREGADGKDGDVYMVKAFGTVIVTTPKQTVYADTAVYEIEKSVIVLKGNPVKLIAGQEQMTAKRLELWQNENVAIARQDVTAQKDTRRLEADIVRAYFIKKEKATEVERFEAENNVVISNDKETVQGDFGVYLVGKETATLQGNVKISQGKNFIIGDVADINMKTGVSRLQMLSERGKTKGQIRGVFVPDEKKKDQKSDGDPVERVLHEGLKEVPDRWKSRFRNLYIAHCQDPDRRADGAEKERDPQKDPTAAEQRSFQFDHRPVSPPFRVSPAPLGA